MNGVLVDTTVWVAKFRNRNDNLASLVPLDLVLSHPMIVTELACGEPPAPQGRSLTDIATLQQTWQAALDEVRSFIERERLYRLDVA